MMNNLLRTILAVVIAAFFAIPLAFAEDAAMQKETAAIDTDDPSDQDPLEGLNRAIFEINGVFYEVTTPIVEATPDPIRGLFKAIGATVTAPVHIVTAIATDNQENDDLADIARENGVDCGFFVVLPLIGPTSSRDALGEAVEFAANPISQVVVLGAGAAVNERIEAEVVIRELDNAVDPYAMARSATLQEQGCVVVDQADVPSAFGDDSQAQSTTGVKENSGAK